MRDKLDTIERRTRILDFLVLNKETTRKELAKMFNVCINTIVNDLDSIGKIAPIFTKQGNGGGVYILPDYRSYKNYLTDKEEEFLFSLISVVNKEEKRILCGIILRFTKNPLQDFDTLFSDK